MKLTCTQEALARGLGIVGRAVAARSPLPITSNVLVSTDNGRLKLAATNLEITMSCWIPATIEEEGAITIPQRLLADFVNSLPSGNITLTLAPRSRQVHLDCSNNKATIGGLDADDFPPAPVVKDGVSVALKPKELRQAIAQTVFAAATDDSRPVLTGVHTNFDGKLLKLAASDGFRLSVFDLPLESAVSEKTEIVIPAKALAEINRLLADEPDELNLRVNSPKTQVLFELVKVEMNQDKTQVLSRRTDVEMVAQLIQGTFPNFSQLIPASWSTKAMVDVGDFLRETRIASVFARDGSGIVRLIVSPGEGAQVGKVQISARADEIGDNEGEVDAAVEGEGVKIAFNGKYLADVLQALSEGRVALEATGPSAQGVFRPDGRTDYTHVIMPMFVQW